MTPTKGTTKPAEPAQEAPPAAAEAVKDPKTPVAPPESILLKLVAILAEVGNVEKKGRNTAQNYSFARESDLVDKVRPIMAREHLFLHQTIVKHRLMQQGQTRTGSTNWLTILTIRFTWMNADTGEIWPTHADWVGYGQDTGDKGIGKAATNAEKFFLFKTFLVATGDDPEADEKTDRRAAEDGAAEGTRVSSRSRTAGQGKGGRSTVPTPVQIREVWRLFNVAGMKAPDVLVFINKTLSVDTSTVSLEKKGELLNFLQSLPAAQVGILIRNLSELTGDGGAEGTSADTAESGSAAPDGPTEPPADGTPDQPPELDQPSELGDQPI